MIKSILESSWSSALGKTVPGRVSVSAAPLSPPVQSVQRLKQ